MRPLARAWRRRLLAALLVMGLLVTACGSNHREQPYYQPQDSSEFFPDGQSARPIVEDTVPRGLLRENSALYTGQVGTAWVNEFPVRLNEEVLARGQERYEIYCVPCHGRTGEGDGIIVRRGFSRPPSYHIDRLRTVEVGYLFDVITNGVGAMPPYETQVAPHDRWAIVAYLRALQLSQNANLRDVPVEDRALLDATATPVHEEGEGE